MSRNDSKKVFFIHLRPHREFPDLLGGSGRSSSAKGGRTLAYTVGDGTIKWGVAKVNPTDHYCKATGRVIATAALLESAPRTIVSPGTDDDTLVTAVIHMVVQDYRQSL